MIWLLVLAVAVVLTDVALARIRRADLSVDVAVLLTRSGPPNSSTSLSV